MFTTRWLQLAPEMFQNRAGSRRDDSIRIMLWSDQRPITVSYPSQFHLEDVNMPCSFVATQDAHRQTNCSSIPLKGFQRQCLHVSSLFQGEEGVKAVLQTLRDELKQAMAQAGQLVKLELCSSTAFHFHIIPRRRSPRQT